MSNEQQPVPFLRMRLPPAAIVQRRNHRFSCACSSHHQITIIPAHFPLCPQLIQNRLLIGIRTDVKQESLLFAFPFFTL